ncbi:hypothetical protein [Methanoculleus frigidifontis]|nr:hypothetical protein [Methanoculleus sp. FWC-SCC1]
MLLAAVVLHQVKKAGEHPIVLHQLVGDFQIENPNVYDCTA